MVHFQAERPPNKYSCVPKQTQGIHLLYKLFALNLQLLVKHRNVRLHFKLLPPSDHWCLLVLNPAHFTRRDLFQNFPSAASDFHLRKKLLLDSDSKFRIVKSLFFRYFRIFPLFIYFQFLLFNVNPYLLFFVDYFLRPWSPFPSLLSNLVQNPSPSALFSILSPQVVDCGVLLFLPFNSSSRDYLFW